MAKRNVDIICVSQKALLNWLQFEDGVIHSIRMNPDKWNPDEVELVIEHPDLHEVQDGSILVRVAPVYAVKLETVNGEEFHKIKRINPPKKEEVEDA